MLDGCQFYVDLKAFAIWEHLKCLALGCKISHNLVGQFEWIQPGFLLLKWINLNHNMDK